MCVNYRGFLSAAEPPASINKSKSDKSFALQRPGGGSGWAVETTASDQLASSLEVYEFFFGNWFIFLSSFEVHDDDESLTTQQPLNSWLVVIHQPTPQFSRFCSLDSRRLPLSFINFSFSTVAFLMDSSEISIKSVAIFFSSLSTRVSPEIYDIKRWSRHSSKVMRRCWLSLSCDICLRNLISFICIFAKKKSQFVTAPSILLKIFN